jgi:hypothetical protein
MADFLVVCIKQTYIERLNKRGGKYDNLQGASGQNIPALENLHGIGQDLLSG